MHQRPALHAGEDGGVELLGDLLVVGEDRAAARPAQGLVRGRRDDVGMREWARMHAAGHKAGEMRHVDHQVGADIVGDLAEAAEIDDARIGGAAGDDHFRPMLFGEPLDFVHVDQVIVPPHAIRRRLEPAPGQVDRRAMRQMTAGGKIEPHEGVARLHERHEHFGIGRRAGMRLHVGEAAAEQFRDPLNGEPLDNVDELAAAVIALARQAFGIFVGQHRALRLKHRATDDIFRRDQLDLVALAPEFLADGIGNLRIAFAERGGEKSLLRECCTMRDRHAVAPRQRWLVIPRRRGTASPESIFTVGGYGFRARCGVYHRAGHFGRTRWLGPE